MLGFIFQHHGSHMGNQHKMTIVDHTSARASWAEKFGSLAAWLPWLPWLGPPLLGRRMLQQISGHPVVNI